MTGKKIIAAYVSLSISMFLGLLAFYYGYFYKPLKSNRELFPAAVPTSQQANDEKISKEKKDIPENLKRLYGISHEEITLATKKIYYVDGREPEEFASDHLSEAINLRTLDIKDINYLKANLNIGEAELNNSMVVIYCHDGTRSADAVAKINHPNVKFLLDGSTVNFYRMYNIFRSDTQPIKTHIKEKDFSISAAEAFKLYKGNGLIIDGRLYPNDKFGFAYDFRIGRLSSEEYKEKLKTIISSKEKEIVYVAEISPDLFYAKLLIQRLEERHGFNPQKFHILFKEEASFYQLLNKERNESKNN